MTAFPQPRCSCGASIPDGHPGPMCDACLAGAMSSGAGGTNSGDTAERLYPGRMLENDRFRLVRRLGRGGMGEVWQAVDERLTRGGHTEIVALKFLASHFRNHPKALDMMREEVLRTRVLQHPNIINLHDWHCEDDDPPFISMEFVDGEVLGTRREQAGGRLGWVDLVPILTPLCDALHYAHRQEVIHRDLKPGNVLITNDVMVKLADFGLARVAVAFRPQNVQMTQAQGTLAYMSPQQLEGHPPSVHDDIYSLGATIYELVTGHSPFEDSWHDSEELKSRILHEEIRPIRQRLGAQRFSESGLTPVIAAVVEACLQKDPDERPRSVEELANRLGLNSGIVSRRQNVAKALDRILFSARKEGRAGGQFDFAMCFLEGREVSRVPQDFDEAFFWFHKAASQGHPPALYQLGRCYELGLGTEANDGFAIESYRRAAVLGVTEAQLALGVLLRRSPQSAEDPDEYFHWLQRAAQHGNMQAQWELGDEYFRGEHRNRDDELAARWFELAARQKHPKALYGYAFLLFHGYGVAKSLDEAARLFREAADLGLPEGQCTVGQLYFDGSVKKRDPIKAVKWFRLSAENGSRDGAYWLGHCLHQGIGTEADLTEARSWYTHAAVAGDDRARQALAELDAVDGSLPE